MPLLSLERLTQGLELGNILAFEFGANLFKAPDRFLCIQSLTAAQTDLGMDVHYCRVHPTTQELFYLFLDHFATTHGALVKRHHLSVSSPASLSIDQGQGDRP
jgi:hypothetical protein